MKQLMMMGLILSSVWSLSLDEAVQRALLHAPSILKVQADVDVAKSNRSQAYASYFPTLDVSYYQQQLDKTSAFSFDTLSRYNLAAKYNLFNGFADKANAEGKSLEYEAQKFLLQAQKSDLKLEVIKAYTHLLKAKKAVQTQKEALDSLERSYNDTKIRYEQGMVAKNELLMIDVQRLAAQQAFVAAQSEQRVAHYNLSRSLGGKLDHSEAIEAFHVQIKEPKAFDDLLKRTYDTRSELKALHKQQEALTSYYDGTGSSYYPRVDLAADYTLNDQERFAGASLVQVEDQTKLSVTVSWALYAGGANSAVREGALARIHSQNATIKAMELDLAYQLREAYEAYKVAKSSMEVAKRSKESAQENYRITQDRFAYGDVDTLVLLKAQSDLTAATNSFNNSYYDLFVAAKTLERISGE